MSQTEVTPGCFMRVGDRPLYWQYYRDHFRVVSLCAEPAVKRVLCCNERLKAYIRPSAALDGAQPLSLFPPALSDGGAQTMLVGAVMTGGRTFLLDEKAYSTLGIRGPLSLDLAKAGWGNGQVEVRPEVKGAGTLFERTKVSIRRLRSLLRRYPRLRSVFDAHCDGEVAPLLFASLASYMRRNLGGQSGRFAMHAAETSAAQLGRSRIKFTPTWLATAQSQRVLSLLHQIRDALQDDAEVFDGVIANEFRLTPSTVRAVYFDKAEDDNVLVALGNRVSERSEELQDAYLEMVCDVRRHLELLADGTIRDAAGTYHWIKIGDINEKFKEDEYGHKTAAVDFRRQRRAWFLAKDEVIVRNHGKFFCDMEAFFGKNVGLKADRWEIIRFHHDLMTLVILRDHVRVLTKFRVAVALRRGRLLTERARKALQERVWRDVLDSLTNAGSASLEVGVEQIHVLLKYSALGNREVVYSHPRQDVAECYP